MKRRLNLLVLSVLVATVAAAQERMPAPQVYCPHPIVLDIKGESSPPTQDPADLPANLIPLTAGSVWNQTAIDKAFAHTFHFKLPGECCIWTKGTLTMEVKALESGPNKSTSVNDGVTVFGNKVIVPPQVSPWTTAVHAGDTRPLNFNIPAGVLAHGMVSFYVEDDTAVVWAHLHLEGCCIH